MIDNADGALMPTLIDDTDGASTQMTNDVENADDDYAASSPPTSPNSPLIQCLLYPALVSTLLQIRFVLSILVSSPPIVQPYLQSKPLVAK